MALKFRDSLLTAAGLVAYYYYVLRYPVTGNGIIHRALNQPTVRPFLHKIMDRYINFEQHKLTILRDYEFSKQDHPARPTDRALAAYNNDSLCGYGELEYTNGGETIPEQQRGVILPLIEKAISETNGGILELGNGNGDVVAYLAELHPDRKFIGVDFSVKNAVAKWGAMPNVEFRAGYPADVLEGLSKDEVKTLFASFTMLCLTGAELENYARIISTKGIDDVLFCEPHWHGWNAAMMTDRKSVHLESIAFYHHYAA